MMVAGKERRQFAAEDLSEVHDTMSTYQILTDSCCDISDAELATWQVRAAQMQVLVEGEESRPNNAVDNAAFYEELRNGKNASTAAVNVAAFHELFEPVLEEGRDILYLCFSAALSTGTYQSANIAADDLRQKYPDRRLLVLDTRCASMGQGLLVYLVTRFQQGGATLDEAYAFAEETAKKMCHWFIVDDLFFLKRGGRVSGVAALLGSALGIKPVLHADDEGRLINVGKARGRIGAIEALVKKFGELVLPENEVVFISHGDCEKDAQTLAARLREEYGVENIVIGKIGPVVGAHSGPGTLALFFLGSAR